MTIVLTHVQRLVLRRLAALARPSRFESIIPNGTHVVRRQYRLALDFLVTHGYVAASEDPARVGVARYTITIEGRRELYPRASRNS